MILQKIGKCKNIQHFIIKQIEKDKRENQSLDKLEQEEGIEEEAANASAGIHKRDYNKIMTKASWAYGEDWEKVGNGAMEQWREAISMFLASGSAKE